MSQSQSMAHVPPDPKRQARTWTETCSSLVEQPRNAHELHLVDHRDQHSPLAYTSDPYRTCYYIYTTAGIRDNLLELPYQKHFVYPAQTNR